MTDNYMIRRAIPDLLDKKYYIPEYTRLPMGENAGTGSFAGLVCFLHW